MWGGGFRGAPPANQKLTSVFGEQLEQLEAGGSARILPVFLQHFGHHGWSLVLAGDLVGGGTVGRGGQHPQNPPPLNFFLRGEAFGVVMGTPPLPKIPFLGFLGRGTLLKMIFGGGADKVYKTKSPP